MTKRLGTIIILGLLATLVLPGVVAAQGTVTPQHSDPNWVASYWDNMELAGSPVLTRSEQNINYNWGVGSPDSRVPADQFSARWERFIDVTAGTYRFVVTSDDGVRLWVDDQLILDEWNDHAEQTFYVDHYLSTGHHLVTMEYYENRGLAVARLTWLRASEAVGRWQAQYYNNTTLSGQPALTRSDATISFNWGEGSPDPGVINRDRFSARWTRTVDFPADNYTFNLTTDDGARLWVNGHLLIDAWYVQAATLYTEDIFLSGPTSIEVEYFENTGLARVALDWSPDIAPEPPTEEVTVDNSDPGFVRGGNLGSWRSVAEGYQGNLFWTFNNDHVRPDYNWARWFPTLEAGDYEVFVYIPERYTTTGQARYWVVHSGGYTLQVRDQSANGGQWVSLGTYTFRGDGSEYVSLADVTFEPYLSRLIAFDAVRWVPR
ncbi:MAG: PA14 domain-containing protein [Anaerolineae bacterium]